MEEYTKAHVEHNGDQFPKQTIYDFFVYHLNRIYPAKSRMEEILSELLEQLTFSDVAVLIRKTLNLVRNQVQRLREIYDLLQLTPLPPEPNDLLGLIEEAYRGIMQQREDTLGFDLSVLAYLQTVESLEIASFKVLQLAAGELANPFISELLNQSIAESEQDYALLLELMTRYIGH